MCGPCAMRLREPCQAGDRAALSGMFRVPQQACTSMFRNFSVYRGCMMKKLKAILSKLIRDFSNAVIHGTVLSVILYYFIAGVIILTGGSEVTAAVSALLMLNIISIIAVSLLYISRKPHKYDSELVGTNFTGLAKRNRIFEKSLEALLNNKPNYGLAGFKKIEQEHFDRLNDSEKALLFFYIARCYEEMIFFPNAIRYYEKAKDAGFSHEIVNLMYARCLGSNGDIRYAVMEYEKILNTADSMYAPYVRTDIGRMYLKQNDAEAALKWYNEAIERHENYAVALGEAAIAHTMLHHFEKGEELYRAALLNNIHDAKGYTAYYKKIQAAALSESHTKECEHNKQQTKE